MNSNAKILIRIPLCLTLGVGLFVGAANANPTVSGGTISWPDNGWYQVQDATTYVSICQGGLSCDVSPGTYRVINHSTGERFANIVVGGIASPTPTTPASVDAVTVTGNAISWPDDGWYQVQDAATYQSVCEGGASCDVNPGTYNVINHSTGERFDNIVVGSIGSPTSTPSTPTTSDGSTVVVTWFSNNYWQVQDPSTGQTLCEGDWRNNPTCELALGTYRVINLDSGQRFESVVIGPDYVSGSTLNPFTLTGAEQPPEGVVEVRPTGESAINISNAEELVNVVFARFQSVIDARVNETVPVDRMSPPETLDTGEGDIVNTYQCLDTFPDGVVGTMVERIYPEGFGDAVERSFDGCTNFSIIYSGSSKKVVLDNGGVEFEFDNYVVNRNSNIINEADGSVSLQVNTSPSLPEGKYVVLSAFDLSTSTFDATPIFELTNGRWDYRRELSAGGSREVQELSGSFTYENVNEFDDSTYSIVSVTANLTGVSDTGVPFDGVLYQTGRMNILSETDNSQLILDPATGDQSTVAITVVSDNGDTSTTVYPWSAFTSAI